MIKNQKQKNQRESKRISKTNHKKKIKEDNNRNQKNQTHVINKIK